MKWIRVSIGSNQGRKRPLVGEVAQCPDCHRREWWLFRLAGDDQLFIQCLFCDRIETVDGAPSAQLEVYALAEADSDDVIHPFDAPGQEVST